MRTEEPPASPSPQTRGDAALTTQGTWRRMPVADFGTGGCLVLSRGSRGCHVFTSGETGRWRLEKGSPSLPPGGASQQLGKARHRLCPGASRGTSPADTLLLAQRGPRGTSHPLRGDAFGLPEALEFVVLC